MSIDDLVKFAVPALAFIGGSFGTTAVYSWRLATKFTSLDKQFEALYERLANDSKLRDMEKQLVTEGQKHRDDMLRVEVAQLAARLTVVEERTKPATAPRAT